MTPAAAVPAAATLFAMILGLLPPAPTDSPKTLQLQPGDQILCAGDSITASGGYVRYIDAVLRTNYPDLKLPPVQKSGVVGQRSDGLVARFDKAVLAKKPALVTVAIGINDVGGSRRGQPLDPQHIEAFRKSITEMVDKAQKAGIRIMLLTPTCFGESPTTEENQRLEKFIAVEKEIAAQKHCELVDLHQLFMDAIEKRGGKTPRLTRDGVHMKDPGDAIMAIGVLRALGVPDDKIAATEAPPPPPKAGKKSPAAATTP